MESTEHDGDVEDYSEGEGESTEPEHSQRLIYYPAAEETARYDFASKCHWQGFLSAYLTLM